MKPNKDSVEKIHSHLLKARDSLDATYKRDFDEIFQRLVSHGVPADDIDYVLNKYLNEYMTIRARIQGLINRTELVLDHIEETENES